MAENALRERIEKIFDSKFNPLIVLGSGDAINFAVEVAAIIQQEQMEKDAGLAESPELWKKVSAKDGKPVSISNLTFAGTKIAAAIRRSLQEKG